MALEAIRKKVSKLNWFYFSQRFFISFTSHSLKLQHESWGEIFTFALCLAFLRQLSQQTQDSKRKKWLRIAETTCATISVTWVFGTICTINVPSSLMPLHYHRHRTERLLLHLLLTHWDPFHLLHSLQCRNDLSQVLSTMSFAIVCFPFSLPLPQQAALPKISMEWRRTHLFGSENMEALQSISWIDLRMKNGSNWGMEFLSIGKLEKEKWHHRSSGECARCRFRFHQRIELLTIQ